MDEAKLEAAIFEPVLPPAEPTQFDIEQAIAAEPVRLTSLAPVPEPEGPPSDEQLVAEVERLATVREQLESALNPIAEAQSEADKARAAVEEVKAEIDRVAALERQEQQVEQAGQAVALQRQQQYQSWAQANDHAFSNRYPDAAGKSAGVLQMLKQEGFTDQGLQAAWAGQGVPLRSAAMQALIYDAYRWRTQQQATPRAVEQPRPRQDYYQPRVVDDGGPLTTREAARLIARGR
jgi:hypothetical protein